MPWLRAEIDRGDKLRRKGQDYLFAGDEESLSQSAQWLDEARSIYESSLKRVEPLARAFNVMWEAQEAVPYYGDWIIHSGTSHESLASVLKSLSALADIAYEDNGDALKRESDWTQRIQAAATEVENDLLRLKRARDERLRARSLSWREIDALLRMPTLEVADRRSLLRRCSSERAPVPKVHCRQTTAASMSPAPIPTF